MGGGPSQSTINQQNALTQEQIGIAQQQANDAAQYNQLAKQSIGRMDTLTAPSVSYNTGVVNAANKGDYSGLIAAAGPATGAITGQMSAARQNIMNTLPPGAARDAALAQLPVQTANAEASTLNQTYQQALNNLTQIGAAYGGVGLQEAGANFSGLAGAGNSFSGAANTNQSAGQMENQGKANTMSFIGALTQGAGVAAGGYFGNH